MRKEEVKATFSSVTATGVVLDNYCNACTAHEKSSKELKLAKQALLDHIGSELDVGTNRFATDHHILKTAINEKYEVDGSDVNALNQALGVLSGLTSYETASAIIQWKPSLNKKMYDTLTDEQKALLAPFLKLSYSSPVLTVEGK